MVDNKKRNKCIVRLRKRGQSNVNKGIRLYEYVHAELRIKRYKNIKIRIRIKMRIN